MKPAHPAGPPPDETSGVGSHLAGSTSEKGSQFVDAGGTAPEDRSFRPDIEGLRAVSVLAVVLFHSQVLHVVGGYVGVDVFFVISGFVITGVLLRNHTATGRPKMLAFYGRRVLRIVPMATVVIAASMIAERVMFGKVVAETFATDARWATLFLANVHPSLLLAPYWSLGVEEQFYLVYPVVVLLVASVGRHWSLRAKLGVALSAIIVGSFSWAALHPVAASASTFARSWELAVGALLAVATGYFKKLAAPSAVVMTWAGLAGLTVIAFFLPYRGSYAGTTAVLPVAAAALIIAGGTAAPRAGAEALLKLGPFKWVGRWSYSLYLWHWPVIYVSQQYWGWGHVNQVGRTALAFFALVLSAVTYFCIENPIRHSARLNRTPAMSIGFGVVLVLACLAVISIAA